MAKLTYAIMGATGHIGHHLVEELLKKGHKVRAIGRDARKLKDLKAKGAEIFSGDSTDIAFLTKAFKGCNAVFSFLPPGYDADDMEVFRDRTSEAIVQALAKTKVPHVLNLSSTGANLASGTGAIKELHIHEERLNLIPHLNVLHFRPHFFMENLLNFLPAAKSNGTISSLLKGDLPIPMVATKDIAMKMAEILDTLKFSGSTVFEFVGPQDVTLVEATKVIGKAIGKPNLKYKQTSFLQAEKDMIAAGMTHQVAKLMVEMQKAYNEKKVMPSQQMTSNHKGKTTLEEFAKSLTQAYSSMKRAA